MRKLAVLDAPSILGLRPSGVENLPDALKSAGLLDRLGAEYGGRVDAPEYRGARDPKTMMLNADGIREFSRRLSGIGGRATSNESVSNSAGRRLAASSLAISWRCADSEGTDFFS